MRSSPRASRLPEALDGRRVSGPVSLRYEDVDQDGHLTIVSLPHALGELVWPDVMKAPESVALALDGVIPILTRLRLEVGDGPISAIRPVHGEAGWHRATVRDASGAVGRLVLIMEVHLSGREGVTLAPPDPDAATLHVGSILAEHAFTRPFAPPSERRVLDLLGRIPASDWEERRFDAVAPAPGPEAPRRRSEHSFGVMHSDPNSHVNSLVYPRLFQEQAILLTGRVGAARALDVLWRKPFFVGETATLEIWAAGQDEVHGVFLDAGGAARCRIEARW